MLWDVDDALNSVFGDPNVDFEPGANPNHLPGLDGKLKLTDAFCADSDPPVVLKGVNPGEWLGVVFNLNFYFLIGYIFEWKLIF